MPYSVIESLALSKPCVVSNCDGNKDLIIDGFNGFVIQNEEIERYVEKILCLLLDNQLLNEFSSNAFSSFNENFNISKNIKKIENFYSEQSKT
jgi:glycosyltransferase involved in cell wall biosynthesis